MVWDRVSVWVVPYPSSQAFQEPVWAGSPVELSMTPADAVQGAALPVSKPGLASFWPGLGQPPPVGLMVQVNVVVPVWPPLVAVAVTGVLPAVVGGAGEKPGPGVVGRPGGGSGVVPGVVAGS